VSCDIRLHNAVVNTYAGGRLCVRVKILWPSWKKYFDGKYCIADR